MNKLNVGDYVDVAGLNEAQRRALGQAIVGMSMMVLLIL